MKDKFPEFYNKLDFEKLWRKCRFVFDTNILINLYSLSKDEYDELIQILEQIRSRLWMPHQIGWEYQKNRHIGIKNTSDKHNTFNGLVNEIKTKLNKVKSSTNDLTELQINYIDLDLINKCLVEMESTITEMINGIESKPNFKDDKIRDKLNSLYKGKVGPEYETSTLMDLCNEGKFRYANNIPPGFGDKNKKSGNPFGDFILWNQMKDYARNNNKPIIFITEDVKDDWWLNREPHPYLIKEFSSTGQDFYMYKFSDFLIEAKKYLKAKIRQKTINKVEKNEKILNFVNNLSDEDLKKLSKIISLKESSNEDFDIIIPTWREFSLNYKPYFPNKREIMHSKDIILSKSDFNTFIESLQNHESQDSASKNNESQDGDDESDS